MGKNADDQPETTAERLNRKDEEPGGQPFILSDPELIVLRLPTNSILEGNMLKLSANDALQIIANLAVQVALGD